MSAKRFRIAFSFAGEKREFIKKVAAILARRFGKSSILYDKFHEAEFARSDLSIYLPELYHDQADLVVVVVSPKYQMREWCGLEWKAIHALIQGRKEAEIMLCRFNNAKLRGLFTGAGYSDMDSKSPKKAADLILERLASNEGLSNEHYITGKGSIGVYRQNNAVSNLPRLPCFFGRETELKTIASVLHPDRQSWGVLIRGPGGIGKTSLAVRAALKAPHGLFDRILFLSAKERTLSSKGPRALAGFIHSSFMEILKEIARLLGKVNLAKCNEIDIPRFVLEALRPEKALLVLDNIETLPTQDQDSIFNFVGRLPHGCKAIVTTRLRTEEDGRVIELGRLTQKAALAYMAQLESDRPSLKDVQRDQLVRLYEETGGNPLLIRWVVGQLGNSRCRTIAKAINYITTAPSDNNPVEFILGDMVGDLSQSEVMAIKGLTGLPGAIEARTLALRTRLSITAATTVLGDLSDRGLIEANPTRQLFSVLPIVADYLTKRMDSKSTFSTNSKFIP